MNTSTSGLIVTIAVYACVVAGVLVYWLVTHKKPEQKDGASKFQRLVYVTVLMLALAGTVQVVYGQYESRQRQQANREALRCQNGINHALVEALKIRSQSTTDTNDKLLAMAEAIYDDKPLEERRAAVKAFIDAMNEQKRLRNERPLPEIPEKCDPDKVEADND